MRSVTGLLLCGAIVVGLWQSRAAAAISASVSYTSQQLNSNTYQYALTLQNTSTAGEPIGTFWFAWIPQSVFGYPYDFLPHLPTGVSSPTGWTGAPLVDGIAPPSGGGTIEWYDTGTPLPAGQSLTGFSFMSSDPPSAIAGTSFFDGYPVATSWVYMGALQSGGNPSDQGAQLTATQSVPEPAFCLPMAGVLLLAFRRR